VTYLQVATYCTAERHTLTHFLYLFIYNNLLYLTLIFFYCNPAATDNSAINSKVMSHLNMFFGIAFKIMQNRDPKIKLAELCMYVIFVEAIKVD